MIASLMLALLTQSPAVREGHQLFGVHCATCHGVNLEGSSQGPPLVNVDAIDVDFMLRTGRMPASIPFEEEEHKAPLFTPRQIAALVAYVSSKSSGSHTLASTAPGDMIKGRAVYVENCEQCHAATGHGDAVGYQDVAPELMDATPVEIAEAVRIGPDVMPRFGPNVISDRDLNDLIAYVRFLQHGQYNPGGMQLANWGPVPEGFIAWTVGIGLLVLLTRRIGTTD